MFIAVYSTEETYEGCDMNILSHVLLTSRQGLDWRIDLLDIR
jgi:hypothetical protein